MSEGIIKRFKDWMSVEEEYEDEYEYEPEEIEEEKEEVKIENTNVQTTKKTNVVNIHTNSQMKVVIAEPKKYEDVTIIADHLRQRRAVIVNLESVEDEPEVKKSIYYFISGAVYILDGSMQKVSKSIFILAPNNVDIDANIKKELESKAFFPWQK
ncbi:cell division protein SepF [Terrisporobacter sp.]